MKTWIITMILLCGIIGINQGPRSKKIALKFCDQIQNISRLDKFPIHARINSYLSPPDEELMILGIAF